MNRLRVFALSSLCLVAIVGLVRAQVPVQKIAGEIVALDGNNLQMRSSAGRMLSVKLAGNLRVSARSLADPAQLAPGAYVGTTAVPQADGTLLAREVHVFPESMRGNGEGHRAMDTEPGSTMTNATVASIAGGGTKQRSTMTNATVADLSGADRDRRLTLAYKGGEKIVIVPDGIPIAMFEPGDRSMLVPGAHIVVYAARQPDGTLTVERITVGKNGFVPPS